jgi:DNA-binding LacI/PurR family transcriptional regulator
MEYLVQTGHRRIAHITVPENQPHGGQRLAAYQDCLARHKIEKRKDYTVRGTFDERSGVAAVEKLLALDEKPMAILASNDRSAIGAMHRAEDFGFEVPSELSVVGYDDNRAVAAFGYFIWA